MEPIVRAVNPITDVELIKIFPGTYDESGNIYFPVQIDHLQLTFHLDEDACWRHQEEADLTDEVRQLIGDLIDKKHA
jgi:hypothetical protein